MNEAPKLLTTTAGREFALTDSDATMLERLLARDISTLTALLRRAEEALGGMFPILRSFDSFCTKNQRGQCQNHLLDDKGNCAISAARGAVAAALSDLRAVRGKP